MRLRHPIRLIVCVLVTVLLARAVRADQPQVTARDLLDPAVLPNADMHMRVEKIEDGAVAKVLTTGAEFVLDKSADTIECRQRIAKQRPVATIHLPAGTCKSLALSSQTEGAAIFSGGGSTVRI